MKRTKKWYAKIGAIGRQNAISSLKKRHDNFVKTYLEDPKHCKYCKKIIPYINRRNDFCNKSCASYYNNNSKKKIKLRPNCAWCGKPLKNITSKLCKTGQCKLLYNVQQFLDGKYVNRIPKISSIRLYYIHIRGHRCEECKNTLWLNKLIPLELHHKDGDYTNNKNENVKLVCRNCHSFTDTFCGKNKGKSTRKRLYTLV